MIKNRRQYLVAKKRLDSLRVDIAKLEESNEGVPEKLMKARFDGIRSMIEEMERDVTFYEALQRNEIPTIVSSHISDLPSILIMARIVRRMTQAELATALSIDAQQIQRYEATGYQSASFKRILQVAEALKIEWHAAVRLAKSDEYSRRYVEMCLLSAGIRSNKRLLEVAQDMHEVTELARACGIEEQALMTVVHLADLQRVRGIGEDYVELLGEAGVQSMSELRKRTALQVYTSLIEANAKRPVVRRAPPLGKVEGWISQAKKLKPIVSY